MGYVFSAFTLAYSLFEIPGGYLGDRMGARRVLMRIVLWWSVFTAATGFAWNYVSMLVTRFLFGAGGWLHLVFPGREFSSCLRTGGGVPPRGVTPLGALGGGP